MSNVKIVRISTGEELICDFSETGPDKVELKNVAILIPTQQNSLGLTQFMAYSNASQSLRMSTEHVMFVVDPVEDLAAQYRQMFSGIIAPQKKLIL